MREKCWKEVVNERGEKVYRHECGDDIPYYESSLMDIVNEPFFKMINLLDLAEHSKEDDFFSVVHLMRDLCNHYQDEMEKLLSFIRENFGNIEISIGRNGDVLAGEPLGVRFETAEFIKKRRAEIDGKMGR